MKRENRGLVLTILSITGLTLACFLPLSINAGRAQTTQSDAITPTCPKCKGTMEAGVVLDYWDNTFNGTKWALGNPKPHLLSLMPKTKDITTYRCTNCGYLESYAK